MVNSVAIELAKPGGLNALPEEVKGPGACDKYLKDAAKRPIAAAKNEFAVENSIQQVS